MGDETDADISLDASNGADTHDNRDINREGQLAKYITWSNTSNQNKVTVTYSNLKNSSYIDQYGTEHAITKIERTFNDFTSKLNNGRDGIFVVSKLIDQFDFLKVNHSTS